MRVTLKSDAARFLTQASKFVHRGQSVVITDLGASRTAEIRERERRYVIAMLFRAVCFVAATLIFHGAARWFAIGIAIVLPWIAVVLANVPKKVISVRHAAYEPAEAARDARPGARPRAPHHRPGLTPSTAPVRPGYAAADASTAAGR